jgi:carbamate kinase
MGGHAFMQRGERGTYEEHQRNARHVSHQVIALLNRGYNLVITHGNGPQVGNLLNQVEATRETVPSLPIDALVAQTEGSLGYFLQQALLNELRQREMRRFVVTMVTQVLVSRDDPGLANPTKPIGPFLSKEDAEERRAALGWEVREDPGRGWRRVVASPTPIKVIQRHMIRQAARAGHIVVACGGGGIPIIKSENGDYVGIEAVIDKDLTSSVLATDIGADLFIILTAVDRVYLNYQKADQTPLNAVTLSQCQRYMEEGHFPAGSMGPKMRAVYEFLARGGRRALITSSERLEEAMDGEAGTHFVGRI